MTMLIDSDGRVTRWPRKEAERQLVLHYLRDRFEVGRTYTEREVNEILNLHHTFSDWALLRRELFEAGTNGPRPQNAYVLAILSDVSSSDFRDRWLSQGQDCESSIKPCGNCYRFCQPKSFGE